MTVEVRDSGSRFVQVNGDVPADYPRRSVFEAFLRCGKRTNDVAADFASMRAATAHQIFGEVTVGADGAQLQN